MFSWFVWLELVHFLAMTVNVRVDYAMHSLLSGWEERGGSFNIYFMGNSIRLKIITVASLLPRILLIKWLCDRNKVHLNWQNIRVFITQLIGQNQVIKCSHPKECICVIIERNVISKVYWNIGYFPVLDTNKQTTLHHVYGYI